MSQTEMYTAKSNSPKTVLVGQISASDTSLTVADASVLPSAPNLLTLGIDENAEVVKYGTITGNVVSNLIRGFSGTTASVWDDGTAVSREYTSYDHDTFIDNINDLSENKQDTLTFDTTPTASSTNPVTSGGVKTALDAKTNLSNGVLFFQNKSTSATSSSAVFCTISDSAITTKHVVTEIYFSVPSAVTSTVEWNTNTAGQVTLKGINTNANNTVTVTLALAGNL